MNKPRFSKNAVNLAGERLVADPTDEEALEVLDYWRGVRTEAPDIIGDRDWLDFFRLASAAISHIENAAVIEVHEHKTFEQIRTELLYEGTEKSFFSKLSAIKEVDEKYSAEDYDYWLLELNVKKSENRIFGFKAEQIETAQEMYSAKEQTPACRRGDVQVVLVSTQSFKDLRQAYPSYFLDVAEFTKTIKNICYKGKSEHEA